MVVTVVLIGLAFFSMFLMVRTVDKNSVVMFEQSEADSNFENLQNAVIQRNSWIASYWWNLNWENRAAINIIAGTQNPVMIAAEIPAGIDCDKEIRVTDSSGKELKSNINQQSSPCSVVFVAGNLTGTYYVYWNNAAAERPDYRAEVASLGNVPPDYDIAPAETSPKYKFCGQAENTAPASGDKLGCVVAGVINNTKVNYAIEYSNPDFSFSGYLS